VRVTDVGTLDAGTPYMVMEYLEGGDLGAWLEQRGPLPMELAVEFILQACEAIADAHGLGIVHRDLKPANLYCIRRSDGRLAVKVLDFGISKVTGPAATGSGMGMTRTTAVFGSPYYMSPEQLQSARDVDSRTDIWSLGVILYELLVGKSPFGGETFAELCIKIATQPAPAIRSLRPDVPAGVEQVIATCLEKDRTKRYANVAELAAALAPFGSRQARASAERISGIIQSAGLSASGVALPPSTVPGASAPHTVASWGQTAPSTTGRRKWLVLGAVCATGLAGVLVFTLKRPPEPRPEAVPSATAQPVVAASALPTNLPEVASAARPSAAPVAVEPAPAASSAAKRPATRTVPVAAAPAKPSAKPAPPVAPPSTAKRGVYDDRR